MVDAEAVQQEKRRPAPLLVQSDWDLSKPGEVCLCHRDLLPVTRGACCEMEAWIDSKTGPGPTSEPGSRPQARGGCTRQGEAAAAALQRRRSPTRSRKLGCRIGKAIRDRRHAPGPVVANRWGLPMEPKYHRAKL